MSRNEWGLLASLTRRWPDALSFSIADQACSAVPPLVIGLLMLSVSSYADFGRYALMTAGVACGSAVFTAIVHDPFTTRAGRHEHLLGDALAVFGGCSIFLWLACAPMLPGSTATSAVAAGLAWAPASALLGLARRSAHFRGRTRGAAVLAATSAAFSLASCLVLYLAGSLSPVAAVCATSLSAACVGACSIARAGPRVRWGDWKPLARDHLAYGGWLLAATPAWVAASHGPLMLLGVLKGEAAAGELRALMLMVLPVGHLAAACGNWLQPRIARVRDRDRSLRQATIVSGGLGIAAGLWLCLLILADRLSVLAFSGPTAAIVGCAALIGAFNVGPTLLVRANRSGAAVFGATAASGATALLVASVAIPAWGACGAALAGLMGAASGLCGQMAFLVSRRRAVRWREALA